MCDCNNNFSCQPWVCLPELGSKIRTQASATSLAVFPQPAGTNPLLAYAKLSTVHCLKIKCPPVIEITALDSLMAFLEDPQNRVTGDDKIIQSFLKGSCAACASPQKCVC